MTETELRATLMRLPFKDLEVEIKGRPRHWLVQVCSPSFAAMAPHERQEQVWKYLLEEHSYEVSREIDFVYTITPEELTEAKQVA